MTPFINLECLTGLWNCIHDTIASHWAAIFIAFMTLFSLAWIGTLHVVKNFLQDVTPFVKLFMRRETLNAYLLALSLSLVIAGLQTILDDPKTALVFTFVGLFLTYITANNFNSDVENFIRRYGADINRILQQRIDRSHQFSDASDESDPELKITS